ncbi:hypothetical protein [Tenacibaculum piscium]|uniref:hypothetical protein n=1 Tax=Tenacibaculum piscium TaxID=1458515 RepID=UPI001F3D677B|nr:hypothetical protein [Tenacibaculum piscium]
MCKRNKANSREHKYKKSDLKYFFNDLEDPVIKKFDRQKPINGTKSSLLKYNHVLCQECNNQKSKKIDNDYDLFSEKYIKELNKKITKIDFDSEIQKLNIYRFLAKNICCRLALNNIEISEDLTEFINGNIKYPKRLIIKIYSNNKETQQMKNYLHERKVPSEIALFGQGKLLLIGKSRDEVNLVYSTLTFNNLIFEFFFTNSDFFLENYYSKNNLEIKQFYETENIKIRINEIIKNL